MSLTVKQQAFVEHYMSTSMQNAAESYRHAYPSSRKWPHQQVAHEAHELLKNPKVAPIVAGARAKADMTIKRAVEEFDLSKKRVMLEIAQLAFDRNLRPDHQLAALMGLARVAGYITDKHQIRTIKRIEDLSDEELEALTAGYDRDGEKLH